MIRSMNNFSTWFTVLMLTIFVVMTAMAFQFPPGARFMPLIVGIPGVVLCVIQLVQDVYIARKGISARSVGAPRAGAHVDPEHPELETPEAEFSIRTVPAELTMWVYLLCYVATILLFGFLVAVPLLVSIYLTREAEVAWPKAVAAAAVATGIMYFFFEVLFRLHLHGGFITPQLLKAVGL